jgi:hypothetical protein
VKGIIHLKVIILQVTWFIIIIIIILFVKCVIDEPDLCFNNRIYDYPLLVGNNLLFARFKRKIMSIFEFDETMINSLTLSNPFIYFICFLFSFFEKKTS